MLFFIKVSCTFHIKHMLLAASSYSHLFLLLCDIQEKEGSRYQLLWEWVFSPQNNLYANLRYPKPEMIFRWHGMILYQLNVLPSGIYLLTKSWIKINRGFLQKKIYTIRNYCDDNHLNGGNRHKWYYVSYKCSIKPTIIVYWIST